MSRAQAFLRVPLTNNDHKHTDTGHLLPDFLPAKYLQIYRTIRRLDRRVGHVAAWPLERDHELERQRRRLGF